MSSGSPPNDPSGQPQAASAESSALLNSAQSKAASRMKMNVRTKDGSKPDSACRPGIDCDEGGPIPRMPQALSTSSSLGQPQAATATHPQAASSSSGQPQAASAKRRGVNPFDSPTPFTPKARGQPQAAPKAPSQPQAAPTQSTVVALTPTTEDIRPPPPTQAQPM